MKKNELNEANEGMAINDSPKEEPTKKINWSIWLFVISMALMILSGVSAYYLQTDGGSIEIYDAMIPQPNGEYTSALVYRPKAATPAKPAPCVITAHGGYNSKEMQDVALVELARRGFVVIAMDDYFHGKSSGSRIPYADTLEYLGLGMVHVTEFAYSNLDYVDKSRIGIMGHSQGGRSTSFTLAAYGRNEKVTAGITENINYKGAPKFANSYKTKVAAALITANIPPAYTMENYPKNVNIGNLVGLYDEGIPSQVSRIKGHIPGDMTVNPEMKNFINLGIPGTFKLEKNINFATKTGKADIKLSGWDANEKIEIGKYYGNIKDGNMRVVYNPAEPHPWNHFSSKTAEHVITFFTDTLNAPKPIPATDQKWFAKEIWNFVGMIGFLIFVLQLTYILLQTKFFGTLMNKAPEKLPALNVASAIRTGVIVIITGLLVLLTYNWCVSTLAFTIFDGPMKIQINPIFIQGATTTNIVVWAVFTGLATLILFLINYFVFDKKAGVTIAQWGLKISGINLLKTILLAVIIVLIAYYAVALCDFFFKADFRLWFIAVKGPALLHLRAALPYIPFFFIFFLVNSLIINGSMRFAGQKEWVVTAIAIAANILGPLLVIGFQYIALFATGEVFFTASQWSSWSTILWLFPFVPFLTATAIYSRKLFDKTGNVWLPAILNTILIVVITCANTLTRHVVS